MRPSCSRLYVFVRLFCVARLRCHAAAENVRIVHIHDHYFVSRGVSARMLWRSGASSVSVVWHGVMLV